MSSEHPEIWHLAGDHAQELVAGLRERSRSSHDELLHDSAPQGSWRLAVDTSGPRAIELAERVVGEGKRWSGRGGVWFSPRPLQWSGGRLAMVFPGVEPEFVTWPLQLDDLSNVLGMECPTLSSTTMSEQAASVAQLGVHLTRVVDRLELEIDEVGGHSIGEWAAAHAAGIVDDADADAVLADLNLERYESELPEVDYVATNGPADVVASAISSFDDVFVSHDNCPRQSMVCGPPERLEAALKVLREVGVRGVRLHVRSGFHTPLLKPAIPEVERFVNRVELRPRRLPVWSATLGGRLPVGSEAVRDVLVHQVVEPVRFAPMVRAMYEDGVRGFLQMGVGSTTTFIEDILGPQEHLAISMVERPHSALHQARRALAALWVDGFARLEVQDLLAESGVAASVPC